MTAHTVLHTIRRTHRAWDGLELALTYLMQHCLLTIPKNAHVSRFFLHVYFSAFTVIISALSACVCRVKKRETWTLAGGRHIA